MMALGDSQLIEFQPVKIMVGKTQLHYQPIKSRKTTPGFPRELQETNARHNGHHQIGFCDGHVVGIKYATLFADDMEARRIWNIDNEPHKTPYD